MKGMVKTTVSEYTEQKKQMEERVKNRPPIHDTVNSGFSHKNKKMSTIDRLRHRIGQATFEEND